MFKHLALVAVVLGLAAGAYAGEEKRATDFAVRKIGGMEVVAIIDAGGMAEGKTDLLVGAGAEDLKNAAAKDGLKMSLNAFIVRLNGKTILFDTGMAISATGGIIPAMAAAGFSPDDIDAVVITHFHFDHVDGLVHRGSRVYDNAELYVPRVEVNKWSEPGVDFLLTYNVRTNVFEAGKEVLPGVTALAAYGHTPGHTVYLLESEGEKLLIVGDLIHMSGVQLPNPDVAMIYDTDPAQAVASRRRVFDMAADQKLPIAAMHIPFPGMGVLTKDGKGYTFEELKGK